jgi:hypothetical protein
MTCLISLIPDVTALNGTNCAAVCAVMILASVVLPLPGGPQKTIDASLSSSTIRLRTLPDQEVCLTDELVQRRGRILSASGRFADRACPVRTSVLNRERGYLSGDLQARQKDSIRETVSLSQQ